MDIDDIPNKNSLQYPVPVTIRISIETNKKLESIKAQGKTKAQILRSLIDSGLKKIEV